MTWINEGSSRFCWDASFTDSGTEMWKPAMCSIRGLLGLSGQLMKSGTKEFNKYRVD